MFVLNDASFIKIIERQSTTEILTLISHDFDDAPLHF